MGQDVTWWDVDEESLKTWPDEYVEWARGIGIEPEPITKPAPFFGLQNDPRMINLLHCDNFILYRIHLRNAPNFHVSYAGGNGFTIWGVLIDTPKSALNSDGIDIGQPWPEVWTDTTNVTVTQSYIHAGDDDLAIKSHTGSLTSNVTVSHNHIYTGGGMGTGSSLTGNINHIRVSDLTIDGAGAGINMKTNNKLGGLVQDVEYDGVCIRDTRNPVHLWTHLNSIGHHEVDATDTNKLPLYRDIRFNNVLIVGGGKVTVDGYDAAHRLGMSFHNLMAAQPEAIQTITDNADIEVDGSNINLSGDNVKITGTPLKGTANNCDGKFVPYPIPFSDQREIPAIEGR